jgi:hexosaminidase
MHDGKLPLDASFTVAVSGYSDARLTSAIRRFQLYLAARTGVSLVPGVVSDARTAKLIVQAQAPGERYPKLGEDESYKLEVTASRVTLTSHNVIGALRGLATLLQLVSADHSGFFLPALGIADQPRFPWRGLMIDVARHFQPEDVIKRNLDGMAAAKMNVLHLHLSDDQGFRVESKQFPKLQGMGSDGLYYTQQQVRDIIEYAADRSIRVVPEFDMPGHATSWMVGYPELASAPGPYQVARTFSVFDPTMDPTRETTYEFLDVFLGEMAELFPDQFIHIGGDENNGKQWSANAQIREFMTAHGYTNTVQLQAYFTQRVAAILQQHGKRMVGWDEILSSNLPSDSVVQSWHGAQGVADSARQGHVMIWSTPYYVDQMSPAEYMYLADPAAAASGLTPEQAKRIVGGEVCAWSEYLSPENIDSRIWPRAAAVAERLWSPAEERDVPDMYRRLDSVSIALQQEGLTHESGPGELLRQIAGSRDLGPLGTLASLAAPEGIGVRQKIRIGNVYDPLVHITDAVVPDPPFRRKFAALVNDYLSDAPSFSKQRNELEQTFASWQSLSRSFVAMEASAPLLQDSEARVVLLGTLGARGIEAMNYLQTGTVPTLAWRDEAMAVIAEVEKPDQSLLKLTWMGSYRALIVAAVRVDRLKSGETSQWKQQVMDEAAAQEPRAVYTW